MARTVEVKPRNDAYTGILAISFLALVVACLLMVLDANELGTPPPKLNVDVPGATPGKAGEGLRRPDAGAAGAAPVVPDKGGDAKEKGGPQSRRLDPANLPDLPQLPAAVVPTAAEAPADPDAPPLPVKPFVPPQ
ncbi:MAG TPA: hypothetical protein VKD90_21625 [Gemmataceae bacterium]|nr:hypothetical protein [Gemmataceae bacterium]